MARVKRGFKARRRRKKLLGLCKGFRGTRKSNIKTAIHVVRRALRYAYRDRRVRKREFRKLWIVRINAASRMYGISYSRLINGLTKANVKIDRKVLADMAVHDKVAFAAVAERAKAALAA